MRVLKLAAKPESSARVWRSLDVDQHADDRRPKGGSTTTTMRRNVATGEAARCGGGWFMRISCRRKARYGGFE
jgi:hypothetical protein